MKLPTEDLLMFSFVVATAEVFFEPDVGDDEKVSAAHLFNF